MSDSDQKSRPGADIDALLAEYRRLLALQEQAIREFDQTDRAGSEWRAKLQAAKGACRATEIARIRLIRRQDGRLP